MSVKSKNDGQHTLAATRKSARQRNAPPETSIEELAKREPKRVVGHLKKQKTHEARKKTQNSKNAVKTPSPTSDKTPRKRISPDEVESEKEKLLDSLRRKKIRAPRRNRNVVKKLQMDLVETPKTNSNNEKRMKKKQKSDDKDSEPDHAISKKDVTIEENGREERSGKEWFDPFDDSIVSKVKHSLHVGTVALDRVPLCREEQVEKLESWFHESIMESKGGVTYLSGVPGTGKTLVASSVVKSILSKKEQNIAQPPVSISINCMRLTNPKEVVERIVAGHRIAAINTLTGCSPQDTILNVSESDILSPSSQEAEDRLARISSAPIEPNPGKTKRVKRSSFSEGDLLRQTGMFVVILDEVDGILSSKKGEDMMGKLFAMATSSSSRLVIIGIANSIDLMQQLLRPGAVLHVRVTHCCMTNMLTLIDFLFYLMQQRNVSPEHIVFQSYTTEEISALLSNRLLDLPGPIIDERAISLCARKIANASGDMRRALEAVVVAVELYVKEVRALKEQGKAPPPEKAPKYQTGIRHMAISLSKLTGGVGQANGSVVTMRKLPVPQQLIMCAIGVLTGEKLVANGININKSQVVANASTSKPLMGTFIQPTNSEEVKHTSKPSSVSLGVLENAHGTMCKAIGVTQYTAMEFSAAVDVLSTLGLITVAKTGSGLDMRRQFVELQTGEDDVWLAFKDVPILKDLVRRE